MGRASAKTIFFIQDAHDSLEAQENMAKIINHLVDAYDVKTVFEEGYEGEIPTDEYFGFIESAEDKQMVSYFLMDKLRLGGAEYAHVNRTMEGRQATQYVRQQMVNAQNVVIRTNKKGVHGRYVADVFYVLSPEKNKVKIFKEGRHLNQELLDRGLVMRV
jgi:hypothetical protein